MSSRRNNHVCVLFDKDHKHFRKGTYSWVTTSTYEEVKAYGKEYDPEKKVLPEPEPEPLTLPEDLPGREHFIEAGKDMEAIKKLAEKGKLTSVAGIGKSTEHKINLYLEN